MLCISILLAEKMIFFRRVIYNFPVFQLLSLRNLKKRKEDDDENVYAVRQVNDDDEEGENEDENKNALIKPGNEVEDPIWPLLIGRAVFRRFRRRRGRRGGWRRRRRGRRGGWRRRRRGRRWG